MVRTADPNYNIGEDDCRRDGGNDFGASIDRDAVVQ